MEGFFLPQVLDTRLLVLKDTRVENPPFYIPLRRMEFTNLPSFSTMAAVTFCGGGLAPAVLGWATVPRAGSRRAVQATRHSPLRRAIRAGIPQRWRVRWHSTGDQRL